MPPNFIFTKSLIEKNKKDLKIKKEQQEKERNQFIKNTVSQGSSYPNEIKKNAKKLIYIPAAVGFITSIASYFFSKKIKYHFQDYSVHDPRISFPLFITITSASIQVIHSSKKILSLPKPKTEAVIIEDLKNKLIKLPPSKKSIFFKKMIDELRPDENIQIYRDIMQILEIPDREKRIFLIERKADFLKYSEDSHNDNLLLTYLMTDFRTYLTPQITNKVDSASTINIILDEENRENLIKAALTVLVSEFRYQNKSNTEIYQATAQAFKLAFNLNTEDISTKRKYFLLDSMKVDKKHDPLLDYLIEDFSAYTFLKKIEISNEHDCNLQPH